jgi:NADH dehydrogenase ubiquinone Fe-S protein 4
MTRISMAARIYKPARNAMQQGMASRDWVLEYEPDQPRVIEPLMGWTSSADTKSQVRLSFATKEEAVAFATRHGIAFRLEEPQETVLRPKSYAENFKFGRPERWTH